VNARPRSRSVQRVEYAIYALLLLIGIAVAVTAWLGVLGTQWAAAATLWVAILVAVGAWLPGRRFSKIDSGDPVLRLATVVGEKCNQDIETHGLLGWSKMDRLRWRLSDQSDAVLRRASDLTDEGTIDQLTVHVGRTSDGVKVPRLVITGEMGGGKTCACLLLAAELAEQFIKKPSGPHRRVPVFLKLSTWDAYSGKITLKDWIKGQLLEDFPYLASIRDGHLAAAMLAERHVLPVMDGLDEMPEEVRPAALQAIEREWRDRPFVLSCRTNEFAQARARVPERHDFHHVLVAELQALRPDEVRDILQTHERPPHAPLAPLVSTLEAQPAGPVAAALSTPFMASLARDTDVSIPELLAAGAKPDGANAVRRHLLGAFVQDKYAEDTRWPKDKARRYLQFLARHAVGRRLEWWQLYQAVPPAVFLIVAIFLAGAICSGLATAFFALFDRPWLGFWIGLGAGIVGGILVWRVDRVPQDLVPRRARPKFRSAKQFTPIELARIIGFGLMGAASLAVISWFLYKSLRYVIIGAVLMGLTFAVARFLSQPNDPVMHVTPDSLLKADRATVLYAALTGAVAGLLTGAYLGLVFRDGHRAAFDSVGILRHPSPVLALLGAVGGAVLSGAGLGLMAMGSSSWGRFVLTRLWLAAQGSTPLRLMTFLKRACESGVLRQVSGYYEFRHQLLQDYLAEPGPELVAEAVDVRLPSAGS
jgi:MFS family permease